MPWFNWSQTAASNAGADPTIDWAEGQAPSSINDSARAMMAATAKYRDDIAGAIVTAGSSTAYTVGSNSVFDTLAHLNGQIIAFSPHVTNAAGPVTLNVDGLGAFPVQPSPGVTLPAGTIIQGTPYVALYNNVAQAFYLMGSYGNPYNIPLAAGLDFWGTTAPNSSFAFPAGQAISRTTYATLFAIMSTTYGSGDGTTTFNLPDKTGRVSAMKEAAATRLTSVGFGGNSANMGATGGNDDVSLTLNNLPTGITAANTAGIAISVTGTPVAPNDGASAVSGGTVNAGNAPASPMTSTGTIGAGAVNVTSNNTGSQASGGAKNVGTVPPTIICNYIIRII